MTPAGCLAAIQNDLVKLARERRIDRLQAYLRGQRFRSLLVMLPSERIDACMCMVERTRRSCKLPAKAKPIGQGRVRWTAPMKAKLARAYAKFGPTAHIPVAAEMGMSPGQVRQAKRTYLDTQVTLLPLAA